MEGGAVIDVLVGVQGKVGGCMEMQRKNKRNWSQHCTIQIWMYCSQTLRQG
jgi:hypothetical protein